MNPWLVAYKMDNWDVRPEHKDKLWSVWSSFTTVEAALSCAVSLSFFPIVRVFSEEEFRHLTSEC